MNYEYEIKVAAGDLPAKELMELKRATGLSLGELKRRMANNEAVFGCQCSDEDGLALMLDLYDSLLTQGFEASLYEDGRLEGVDLFRNLLESWRSTGHEVGLDEF